MRTPRIWIALCGLALAAAPARGEGPSFASVAELQQAHDRALIRDLKEYIRARPKADDVDQAYMAVFNRAIEHDWFVDHEDLACRYLADHPGGPIQSLARIVATMARAQAGKFADALARYHELMRDLGKPEQEEFAANFADSLAGAATAAGEYEVARQVYQGLIDRYGDSPNLRQKVRDDLARLDLVGKPAPAVAAHDLKGDAIRLDDLRGKYFLVDFWATWCAPCVAELPRLQAAYAKYRDAGFEIVGVSLDETRAAPTDFARSRNIPWRQVHNASGGGDLVEAFGVRTIPATFLIDPRGTIVRLDLRGPALDKALAELIPRPAALRGAERPAR
jgi:peroxiredoxin